MSDSSLLVRLIAISVGLSTLTIVILFVALIVVRTTNGISRARRTALTSRWRAIFVTAYTGAAAPAPLPAVGKHDWFTVLQLFEQFHELRDHDRARGPEVFPVLDAMAAQIGLDLYAIGLLKKKDLAGKIVAFNVLGHLRDSRAFDLAATYCTDEVPELSRAAAHCALRIDGAFVDRLLELLRERDDWARPRVELMLREVAPERLDRAMLHAFNVKDEVGRTRLLDFMRFCTPSVAHTICRDVVAETEDVETVAAALRSLAPLAGEADRDIAMRYCRSAEPAVALGGLRVLRKCAHADDEQLLRELTANRDYWVRLRAAEVVVQLSGDTGLAQQFAEQHPDRYARDAVRQALAERKRVDAHRNRTDRRGLPEAVAVPA